MSIRLANIEEKILELWKQRDTVQAEAERQAEEQAKRAREKAEARKALPELREREREAWSRYIGAVHELQAAIDGLEELRPELGRAFARLRYTAPKGMRSAIKRELSRLAIYSRKARDEEAERKARARRLRETAKAMEKARRTMAGGNGSIDQARQRIDDLQQSADVAEGKAKSKKADDNAMFIPAEVALGQGAGRGA